MPENPGEIIELLSYLLPGLLVAWIFYTLTDHVKPDYFERIIQALIFTFLVKFCVTFERIILSPFVTSDSGGWNKDIELLATVITALLLGLGIALCANKDTLHQWLRKWGFSQRSSAPNEWCSVFSLYDRYIVLHLNDGRRLYGWPKVWPSDPDSGHIFVTNASWIHCERPVELAASEGLLIRVRDVAYVELMHNPEEEK